jgi:anti-sigma B factor antagonist
MMEITFETIDGVGVIKLSGTLTAGVVERLHEQFNIWYAEEKGVSNLLIDMADVGAMDSSGLGALIGIMKKTAEDNAGLKIAALQDKTRLVFEITQAYKLFDIFDTVEEAMRNCA